MRRPVGVGRHIIGADGGGGVHDHGGQVGALHHRLDHALGLGLGALVGADRLLRRGGVLLPWRACRRRAGRSVATEETWTMRGTPASRAACMTAAVPITLVSRIWPGIGHEDAVIGGRVDDAADAGHGVDQALLVGDGAERIGDVEPLQPLARAAWGRTRARTAWPWASSARASEAPRKPVAPVSRMVVGGMPPCGRGAASRSSRAMMAANDPAPNPPARPPGAPARPGPRRRGRGGGALPRRPARP
jgi:hypothetical protein